MHAERVGSSCAEQYEKERIRCIGGAKWHLTAAFAFDVCTLGLCRCYMTASVFDRICTVSCVAIGAVYDEQSCTSVEGMTHLELTNIASELKKVTKNELSPLAIIGRQGNFSISGRGYDLVAACSKKIGHMALT